MNPANKSRPGGREPPAGADEVDAQNKQTPSTDLQPEDAGTPDSGSGGHGGASGSGMKPTSPTGRETARSQR